jgi:hypothetical protein
LLNVKVRAQIEKLAAEKREWGLFNELSKIAFDIRKIVRPERQPQAVLDWLTSSGFPRLSGKGSTPGAVKPRAAGGSWYRIIGGGMGRHSTLRRGWALTGSPTAALGSALTNRCQIHVADNAYSEQAFPTWIGFSTLRAVAPTGLGAHGDGSARGGANLMPSSNGEHGLPIVW